MEPVPPLVTLATYVMIPRRTPWVARTDRGMVRIERCAGESPLSLNVVSKKPSR